MHKCIKTTYSSEMDMTFILEETYKKVDKVDGEYTLISREVKGFYHGEPDKELTIKYYGELKTKYY